MDIQICRGRHPRDLGTEGIADVFGMVRIARIASRDGHHLAINGSIPPNSNVLALEHL